MATQSVCSIPECGKPVASKGMCGMHVSRVRRHGDPNVVIHAGGKPPRDKCSIEDCDQPHYARGHCKRHYERLMRSGHPTDAGRNKPGGPCLVDGCPRPAVTMNYCNRHYLKYRKYGDATITKMAQAEKGEPECFFREVVMTYDGDECLTWPFADNGAGYGILHRDGRMRLVSRLVCEEVNGPAPTPDHETAHNCGRGHLGCVTKGHLRWATHSENQMDRVDHDTHTRGERCPTAKLTEAEVQKIRGLRGKLSQARIAEMFGVSAGQVARIHLRKQWGWLE